MYTYPCLIAIPSFLFLLLIFKPFWHSLSACTPAMTLITTYAKLMTVNNRSIEHIFSIDPTITYLNNITRPIGSAAQTKHQLLYALLSSPTSIIVPPIDDAHHPPRVLPAKNHTNRIELHDSHSPPINISPSPLLSSAPTSLITRCVNHLQHHYRQNRSKKAIRLLKKTTSSCTTSSSSSFHGASHTLPPLHNHQHRWSISFRAAFDISTHPNPFTRPTNYRSPLARRPLPQTRHIGWCQLLASTRYR